MSSIADGIPQKECSLCKEKFPATTEYFYAHKTSGDGLQTRCKSCYKKIALKYIAENPEKVRESKKKYSREHPEKAREGAKRYRLKHPEKVRASSKRARKKNPEKKRENDKRFRQRHPEKGRERRRKWEQEHPETVRIRTRRRRAIQHNAPGEYTNEDLQALYELQQGRCCWCGQPMGNKLTDHHLSRYEKFTDDHVIPIGRGGSGYPYNIVLACWRCNCSRRDRLVFIEWQPPNMLEWMYEYVENALRKHGDNL